ncbi:MAG: PRTRC system ThiF family protein [Anaerolineaceae bacterium]|nr:PRTRC system ThiF family protein [Anaerolineaceae bacterium]
MNVFDPNTHIQTVTVVGLGGTGAQVARAVARMVVDMKTARLHIPQIVLIDPDTVEEKNVGRQLYTAADVGQKKAHVLMRRFNLALGLDISAIDQPVSAEKNFERWGNLVIGAVDNHLARRELARVNGAIWIDAGNHANAGQVVIGNTGDRETALRYLDGQNGRYPYLPHAGLLFPALLEPEPEVKPQPEPERSCAELVAAREQDVLVNDWMATITAQYVYKLLRRQPITSFVSYVSADGMSVRSLPICREELEPYLREESPC